MEDEKYYVSSDQLKEYIKFLNKFLELDENHTVVAIFEDNDHDEIIGWSVIEKAVDGEYPIYEDLEKMFEVYGKQM